MATGKVPFPGVDQYKVFPKIRNREIEWPTEPMDPELRTLIDELLQVETTARLGAIGTDHDMNALMAHPFFDGIDFKSDLSQLGVEQILSDTEPPEVRARRL